MSILDDVLSSISNFESRLSKAWYPQTPELPEYFNQYRGLSPEEQEEMQQQRAATTPAAQALPTAPIGAILESAVPNVAPPVPEQSDALMTEVFKGIVSAEEAVDKLFQDVRAITPAIDSPTKAPAEQKVQPRAVTPQEARAAELNKIFETDNTYTDQGIRARVQGNGVIEFSNAAARGETSLAPIPERTKLTVTALSEQLKTIQNTEDPTIRQEMLTQAREDGFQLLQEVRTNIATEVDKTLGIAYLQTKLQQSEAMDRWRSDKYENPINPQIEALRDTLDKRLQQRETKIDLAMSQNIQANAINERIKALESYSARMEKKADVADQRALTQDLRTQAMEDNALANTPLLVIERARNLLNLSPELTDGQVALQLTNKNLAKDKLTTAALYASSPEALIDETLANKNPTARKVLITEEIARTGASEEQIDLLLSRINTLATDSTKLIQTLRNMGKSEEAQTAAAEARIAMAGTKEEQATARKSLLDKAIRVLREEQQDKFVGDLRNWQNLGDPALQESILALGSEANLVNVARAYVGNAQGMERNAKIQTLEKALVANGRSLQDSAIVSLNIPLLVLGLPNLLDQEVFESAQMADILERIFSIRTPASLEIDPTDVSGTAFRRIKN